METKICKYCGKEKPVDQFHTNQWGYTSVCKECNSHRVSSGIMNAMSYVQHDENGKRKRVSKQMRRIAELEAQLEKCSDKKLSEFTPREIFVHLKKLGYKWEKMVFVKIEEVDWNKI